MKPLGIIVFGCLTKDKYRQQLEDIYATWGKEAIRLGCLLRFYVGDIPSDCSDELKDISVDLKQGDDYISATFKQWCGIEHMICKEDPCAFYYICGSDTFLNVPNALTTLQQLDPSKSLYIGGGIGCEPVDGKPAEYFSGGAGFFLTNSACHLLNDEIPDFIWYWLEVGKPLVDYIDENGNTKQKSILAASDLQLGVLCKRLPIEWVKLDPAIMIGVGKWTDNKDGLISCHPLLHDDFIAYDSYLKSVGAFGV